MTPAVVRALWPRRPSPGPPDRMPGSDWALAATVAAAGLLTRLPLRARRLPTWDAVQFALALDEYDIVKHQPHPPGYVLYVVLGRAVRAVVGDPATSLTVLAAVASAATLLLLYRLAFALYDRRTAVLAATGLLVSPLFWFYGLVGLPYAAEAALATLVTLAAWSLRAGGGRALVLSAAILGAAAGVRQTILVLLLPLWLVTAWQGFRRWRPLAAGLGVMGGVALAWFVPMVWATGGLAHYLAAGLELFDSTVRGTTIVTGRWPANVERLGEGALLGTGLFLPALAGLGLAAGRRIRGWGPRAWLLAAWIVPPLGVYTLLHVGQYGYLLTVLPALYLVLARGFWRGLDRWRAAGAGPALLPAGVAVWILALALHGAFFLAAPPGEVHFAGAGAPRAARWRAEAGLRYRFNLWQHTLPGLRQTEAVVAAYVATVRERFSPRDTVLVTEVGNPRSNAWFRHVSYYLADYPALHVRVGTLAPGYIVTPGPGGMASVKDRHILLPTGARRLVWVVDHWDPAVRQPDGLEAVAVPYGRWLYVLDLGRAPVDHAGYRLTPVTAVARLR